MSVDGSLHLIRFSAAVTIAWRLAVSARALWLAEASRRTSDRARLFLWYSVTRATVRFVATVAAAAALLSPFVHAWWPGEDDWAARHWPRPSDSQTIAVLALVAAADALVPELPTPTQSHEANASEAVASALGAFHALMRAVLLWFASVAIGEGVLHRFAWTLATVCIIFHAFVAFVAFVAAIAAATRVISYYLGHNA
jgi:hypothetical protein